MTLSRLTQFLSLCAMLVMTALAQVPTNGLVAHYPFNNGLLDQSGIGNHASAVGNPTFVADRFGNPSAAVAVHSTGYLTAPTVGLPIGNSPRTIAMWVRSSNFDVGNRFLCGWGTPNTLSRMSALVLGLGNQPSQLAGFWGWGDDIASTTILANYNWHHVAFTYDGAIGRVFINGLLSASSVLSLNTPAGTTLYIGNFVTVMSSFVGEVDDIVIYDRPLQENEISNLSSGSHQGTCETPVDVTPIDASLDPTFHWFIPGNEVFDNKVFVFGVRIPTGSSLVQGTDAILTFDLVSRTWSQLPFRLPYVNVDAGVTAARIGNAFYLPPGHTAGNSNGWGSTNGLIKVDIAAGAATIVAHFPFSAIWNLGNCAANGKIYYFGGHTGVDQTGIFEFDPTTNDLVRVAEMLQPATWVSPTLASDGWIYFWSPARWHTPVQRFNPVTQVVQQRAAVNPARRVVLAIQKWYVEAENTIYFIPDEESPAHLFKYDISNDVMVTLNCQLPASFVHEPSIQDPSDPFLIYVFQRSSIPPFFANVLSKLELRSIAVPGSITGTVTSGGQPLQGVTVKLLDAQGLPVNSFDPFPTDNNGRYLFGDVAAGDYHIMLIEPLGFSVDLNPKHVNVAGGAESRVDFELIPTVLENSARGFGYWKHQFDVQVTGRGSGQETAQQLSAYVSLIHQHYSPHFGYFNGKESFADWQTVLSQKGNATMFLRARAHLASFVLNLVSEKIGQYTVVSADGRNAGDVLTYVSYLLGDQDPANDERAKDLAEMVNSQQLIPHGAIPIGTILYKGATPRIDWSFGKPTSYTLRQNYPNPFNPSTVIAFALPKAGHASLRIYNTLGQEIAVLINETVSAGIHRVAWDAARMASGVYLYRLQAGDFVETKKLLLLR